MTEPSQDTYLIVGLGNPGRDYRDNRHNVGFMLIDRLAARLGVAFSRMESRALVTKGEHAERRIILAKPQTFMNLSGQAVGALARYYKIPLENLIIAYDEVDLPFGSLRIRASGGSGGHKGISSVIERLGTEDIPRLRIGISRPPGRKEAADYVLQDFTNSECKELPAILDQAVEAVLVFIEQGINAAMNKYNAGNINE